MERGSWQQVRLQPGAGEPGRGTSWVPVLERGKGAAVTGGGVKIEGDNHPGMVKQVASSTAP